MGYCHWETERRLSGATLTVIMDAVLSRKTPFRFRSDGRSMDPFIKSGDILTLAPIDQKIFVGDLVGFIHPLSKRFGVHRIVGKSGDYFQVKGDNLPVADGLVRASDLIGRITLVEREGKAVRIGCGPERVFIALLSRWAVWTRLRGWWSILRKKAWRGERRTIS